MCLLPWSVCYWSAVPCLLPWLLCYISFLSLFQQPRKRQVLVSIRPLKAGVEGSKTSPIFAYSWDHFFVYIYVIVSLRVHQVFKQAFWTMQQLHDTAPPTARAMENLYGIV